MKRRLLFITLAIVVLVAGVNLVTRGEYLSGKVRALIVEKAREKLGYEAGMERLVFNFFPAYIDIESPYVKGWDPTDPGRSVSAGRARIYFSLSALMNREIVMNRVQLYGANVRLIRFPDGSLNIDSFVDRLKKLSEEKKGKAKEEYNVKLREAVFFDSGGVYEDLGEGVRLTVKDAGVDLRFMDGGRFRAGCSIGDLLAHRSGTPPVRMKIKGDLVYTGEGVEVGLLRVDAGKTRVAGSGRVFWKDALDLDVKLDADVDLKLLETLGITGEEGPAGTAVLEGVVKGIYPDLTGKGELSARGLGYRGVEVRRVDSELTFEGGRLDFRNVRWDIYGGSVAGEAEVDFTGDEIVHRSSWRLKDIITGQYTWKREDLRFIPWQSVSGLVNVTGRGLDISTVQAAGSMNVARYDRPHPREGESPDLAIINSVDVDFGIKDEKVIISSGRAASMHTVADFKGTVGLDGETEVSISGNSADIDDISKMVWYEDMDGRLDVTASMTGNIVAPTIRGKARISGARAGGVSFPSAYGDVELKDWKLSFTDFSIMPEQGSFLLNGSIKFQGDGAEFDNPRFDAVLDVHGADVRKITSIFYEDIPVNLFADGVMEFHGNTGVFGGKAHLTTGAGDVYGQKLDKGEVSCVLTEDDVSFPKVIAVKGRDIVSGTGSIGFDGTFKGSITSARFDLENFGLLTGTGVPVKGSVSMSVDGKGSFEDPVINGKLSAYTLFLKDVDLGEASLDLAIKDDRLTGEGALLDNKVRFDGFIEFNPPCRWMGRLAFNEGRFEPFVRMIYPKLPDEVSLVSTGLLTARGSLDEPEKDRAAINFSRVAANIMGSKLANDGDISITYDGGQVEVGSLKLAGDGMYLDVSGGAEAGGELDLTVKAMLDLAASRRILEESIDYIDGSCEADITVTGGAGDPVVRGRVSVTHGGLKLRGFPQKFEDLSAEVRFDGKEFTLTRLKAGLGGGTVAAEGRGGIRGLKPDNFSFAVKAADVKLKYPEELATTLDAKLFLEGAESKASVSGDIIVKKARYTKRVDWKSWLVQFNKETGKVAGTGPGPLDDVSLNVHITGAESIRVDNNVAKLAITPDLLVRGTIGSPVIIGRLESAGGKVYFRNNEFNLTNAVAEFADPTRLNPIIDLQAETSVREYQIQLTLTGTLDRIKVALLSDPPLGDADIITLLTLGKTAEGIEGRESALTQGEAASFVTGQIQDAVEERVRRVTGFDRFQIDPYLTSSGISTGPRLTVGKRLFSDRLYITFSSNLGTSEDQFVRLEYTINKNLSFVGERDELGRFGGDLKLRFGFK